MKTILTKSEKVFSIIFTIIVITELICDTIESLTNFHYFTKPLILISLICFFQIQTNQLNFKTKYITFLALLFSLTGDILLMFTNLSAYFFMGGLLAFLLAHIMYIFLFSMKKDTSNKIGFLALILTTFSIIIFYFLKDGLGEFLTPVIIYMLTILTMVIMAYFRKGSVSKISFIFVFLGALFFITSDSLLALNKFYKPFPFAGIFIMLTYAIAQFFIVLGLKKQQ